MKNKKLLFGSIAIVLIATLIYLYIRYKKSKRVNDVVIMPNDNYTKPVVVTGNDSFPLKYGSKGANVEQLQRWINQEANIFKSYIPIPYTPLKIDGSWGSKTDSALKFIASYGYVNVFKDALYPAVSKSFFEENIRNIKTITPYLFSDL